MHSGQPSVARVEPENLNFEDQLVTQPDVLRTATAHFWDGRLFFRFKDKNTRHWKPPPSTPGRLWQEAAQPHRRAVTCVQRAADSYTVRKLPADATGLKCSGNYQLKTTSLTMSRQTRTTIHLLCKKNPFKKKNVFTPVFEDSAYVKVSQCYNRKLFATVMGKRVKKKLFLHKVSAIKWPLI